MFGARQFFPFDDVITWKRFRHHWPFVVSIYLPLRQFDKQEMGAEIHRSPMDPPNKGPGIMTGFPPRTLDTPDDCRSVCYIREACETESQKKNPDFSSFKTVYTYAKTHITRLSLHGLNNKHIRNTASMSFEQFWSQNYFKNLLKHSMSHGLNRRLTHVCARSTSGTPQWMDVHSCNNYSLMGHH